jgi:hypothetical protein
MCGWVAPPKNPEPVIYDRELREVYKGDATPEESKIKELVRLRAIAGLRGYRVGWVIREYRHLFKGVVPADVFTPDELDEYYASLLEIAQKKGRALGWAKGCFKSTFGFWPSAY